MTVTMRTLKGFADGFGGGVLGGAIYAGLVTALGGVREPSPVFNATWLRILTLALLLGIVEATRVGHGWQKKLATDKHR